MKPLLEAPDGVKQAITIWSRSHGKANTILLTEEWRKKHGYIGLPSRKIFTFPNVADRDEVARRFAQAGIPHVVS